MASYRRKRLNGLAPTSAKSRQFHGEPKKKQTPEQQLLSIAKERFRMASDAEDKQRNREQDDLRFYAGEQWPSDLLISRQGQAAIGNLPPVPARPCLVVNQSLQPVAQVLNQERSMDMGVELLAADDFEEITGPSDHSEVELREGLIRRLQRAAETADARTWAFERAAIAGRGFWGITTKFSDLALRGKPGDSAWDQELVVEKFFNQASVLLDPAHESSTGADAEWGFVGGYVPWEQYKRDFPKVDGKDNPVVSRVSSDEDFRALGDEEPGWFTYQSTQGRDQNVADTSIRMCRVVNYYYTVRQNRTLALLPDGVTTAWQDELPEGAETKQTRDVIQKLIKWAKIDGKQVLDQTDWPGPDIPIIKVVGRELQPYSDDRPVQGIVRPMRDSGQAMNYTLSKAMELTVGLPPMAQWKMAAGQDEGYEHEWQLAGVRTIGTLHFNELDGSGRPFNSQPERIDNGPQGVEPLFQSIGLLNSFIKDTTLTPAAALGQQDITQKSGKALEMQIQQSQRGTSNFLDNQARSIRREGEILNNLLYPIYGIRPGRIARVLSSENETQTMQIGQPPPQVMQPGQAPPPQPATPPKIATLTPDARFSVAVKVSRSYDTLREEVTSVLGEMIAKIPTLMGVVGDKWASGLPVPEAKEIAERIKTTLIPPVQQLLAMKAQGGGPPDPQVQQLQQQIQQLLQQLQQASGEMAGKQLDAQTKLQIAQLDSQSREKIAIINAQALLASKGQQVESDKFDTIIENETKRLGIMTDAQIKHEDALIRDKGTLHDTLAAAASQGADHAHERHMSNLEHGQAQQLVAQQASHAQDAAVQQAALTPPPTEKPNAGA